MTEDNTVSTGTISGTIQTASDNPSLLVATSIMASVREIDDATGAALCALASADASTRGGQILPTTTDHGADKLRRGALSVREALLHDLAEWQDPRSIRGEIVTHVDIGVPFFTPADYTRFREQFALLDDDALVRVIQVISETDNDSARAYRLVKSLVLAAEATIGWALDVELAVERTKDPHRCSELEAALSNSGRSLTVSGGKFVLLRELRKGSRRPRATVRGANVDGRRMPTVWVPRLPECELRARVIGDIVSPLSILGQFDPDFLRSILGPPWILDTLIDAVVVLVTKTANPQGAFAEALYPVFQVMGLHSDRPNGQGARPARTKRNDLASEIDRVSRRENRAAHVLRVILERGLKLSSDDGDRSPSPGGHRLIDRLRDESPPKVAPRPKGRARPVTDKKRRQAAKEKATNLAEQRAKAAGLRRQRRKSQTKWASDRKRLARSRRAELFEILSSRR